MQQWIVVYNKNNVLRNGHGVIEFIWDLLSDNSDTLLQRNLTVKEIYFWWGWTQKIGIYSGASKTSHQGHPSNPQPMVYCVSKWNESRPINYFNCYFNIWSVLQFKQCKQHHMLSLITNQSITTACWMLLLTDTTVQKVSEFQSAGDIICWIMNKWNSSLRLSLTNCGNGRWVRWI